MVKRCKLLLLQVLAGAARQPLFSVILSPSIYLSIYVCRQIFAAANCWANRLTPGVVHTATLQVYAINFPAHCASVTNMFPCDNLHCVSKEVPTFKLSVIWSNVNRFSIFCTVGKQRYSKCSK